MLINPRDAMYVISGRTMRGRVIAYFRFSKWMPSAILDFYFRNYVKKSNLRLYRRRHAKFGEDRTIRGRVISYFRFSKWRPSAILDFRIFAIFVVINDWILLHHYVFVMLNYYYA